MDYSILVGGAAGQGIDTVVNLLEKTIKRYGYYVFTYKNFMSMVEGGHNFRHRILSDEPDASYSTMHDVIFALNEETITLHKDRLKPNGVVIIDNEVAKAGEYNHLPLNRIAKD